jgi:2',3'-cyclic-nucleotide 2'-phosphodiesterase (5'-nucleotidase family)
LPITRNYLNKSDGELNTAIGNFMADVVLEQANPIFKSRTGNDIDMVILNHGGIRSTIEEGPLTARTAYSIMPFENEIVVAELSGTKIREMLAYLENNRTAHPVSGIKIEMDRDYKITSASIDGQPIEEDGSYFVATSDYLQQGGDNMNFLKDPKSLHVIDYKLRNAYIDYFNKVDTLKTARDDRYIRSN